jgi:hypothetical protein
MRKSAIDGSPNNRRKEYHMARQVKTNAPGNSGNTAGAVKTPAPDQISKVRAPSGVGYGMNFDVTGSSVEPGKRVLSPLAANTESTIQDEALSEVIANGTARNQNVTDQLRTISDGGIKPAHGMTGASKGPTIPAGPSFGGNNSAFGAELAAKRHGKK